MVTDGSPEDQPAIDETIRAARDDAVTTVLRRNGLHDKRFHNEAVLREVADAVAEAVAAAIRRGS